MTDRMTDRRLRLGTRGSALALAQTAEAARALAAQSVETEQLIIESEGDRDRTTSLHTLGGQGIFVRTLERALLNGEIDVAVHSAKDVPSSPLAATELAAFLPRADLRDALVTTDGAALDALPPAARVGTGSRRRAAQLLARRPDLIPTDIRGNVDTRLRKLADGEVDALLLAAAGLIRLDRTDAATELLPPDVMLPAPGQGAIALQCRAADAAARALLAACDHPPTRIAVTAERAVLAALGVGCSLPIAALAHARAGEVVLLARLLSPDGSRRIEVQRSAPEADAEPLGREVGEALLERGGRALLAELEQ